jgi:UDP-glucose 4-epimerase
VRGSVLDAALVESLAARADRVVHLAAVVGVRRVLAEPSRMHETNVRGTETVVAAAERHGRPVLVASSSEVYGASRRVPFREDAPVVAAAPSESRWAYAAGKLAAERLALARHAAGGLPVRVVRFFNTAGPRQVGEHGMVLPRLVAAALAGEPLVVHGDGRQTRAFCHVADAVEAVLRLCDAEEAAGRVVNVGATEETTIRTLAERVLAATGSRSPIVHVPHAEVFGAAFDDPPRRAADVTLLRSLTGFAPARRLDEIVRDAVAWARGACVAAA